MDLLLMADANMAHPAFKPRILTVTWNTAGRLTKQNLKTWMDTTGNRDAAAWHSWLKRAIKPGIPDIVVLSLQEWNLSNAFPVAFGHWLNDIVPGGYHTSGSTLKNAWFLRKYRRDFSQRLVVFVRTEHVPVLMLTRSRKKRKADKQRIKEAKAAYEARLELEREEPLFNEPAFRKVHPDPALDLPDDLDSMPHLVNQICHGSSHVCTKGSIVARMQIQGSPLYIVSSHFPFRGQDNIEVRNKAYNEVINAVPELMLDPTALVIWLGDLNYRMQSAYPAEDKHFDQLRKVIADRTAFDGYKEGPKDQGPFGFNPTCKMVVLPKGNADDRREAFRLARIKARPQAYNPKRIESWCDRVLWHQGLNYHGTPQLEVLSYTQASIDGSLHSDHTAVAAVLQYV